METLYRMREALKKVYDGDRWRKKVNQMEDSQVVAVYKEFQRKGMIK